MAKLVEILGGTISVRSAPGEGSTFAVRLPILAPGPRGGREGVELARRLRPDAITLDVMMPEMDGWSVLATLKADPITAAIPVILLTVLQRRGLGLMLGAADDLTKPLDRDHLIRALKGLRPAAALGPILIVDDEADIRDILSLELKAAGLGAVVTAIDGVRGLEAARRQTPSLVVLDLSDAQPRRLRGRRPPPARRGHPRRAHPDPDGQGPEPPGPGAPRRRHRGRHPEGGRARRRPDRPPRHHPGQPGRPSRGLRPSTGRPGYDLGSTAPKSGFSVGSTFCPRPLPRCEFSSMILFICPAVSSTRLVTQSQNISTITPPREPYVLL